MSAEVRPGYKQTESGVLPEDWESKQFTEVTDLITCGIAATPEYVSESKGFPFLSSTNVKDGKIIWSNFKFITESLHKQLYRNNPPKNGDILYSRVGTIGEAAVVDVDFEFSIYVSLTLIKPKKMLDSHYLMHVLNSAPYRARAKEQVYLGGGVGNLNVDVVRHYPIYVPSLSEQHKIAATLSDIIKLISSLEQLIAKKRDIQQATMQQLLTGQRRLPGFSDEWEVANLGEISFISKGEQLSQRGDATGLVPHFNGGVSASSYTDTANTPNDTIAISEGGNSCGFVQFITTPFWCGGHCYTVLPRGIENIFLYFALKGKQDSIMGLRVGSGLPNIQKSALNSFQIALPSNRDEQTAIATILSDMGAELATLEARRDKARQLKQGMMQELLTGRIRLTNSAL